MNNIFLNLDVRINQDIGLPLQGSLPKKFLYSEFFWSLFSRIRTESGEILRLSVFSSNGGNTEQKKSEYGHNSLSLARNSQEIFQRQLRDFVKH